jgi:hypothetical protein
MMVREGWDGTLVFATDIGTQGRGGVLDAAFERSSSWSRERRRPSRCTHTRPKRTRTLPLMLVLPLHARGRGR